MAALHGVWLSPVLTRAGPEVTPDRIAQAWTTGLSAAVRGHAPAVGHGQARWTEKLAGEFERAGRGRK